MHSRCEHFPQPLSSSKKPSAWSFTLTVADSTTKRTPLARIKLQFLDFFFHARHTAPMLVSRREKRKLIHLLRQKEKDEAYQRRLRCRELIFGKGKGYSSALSPTEKKFCISVAKESYQLYLAEFQGAKPRYAVGKTWARKLRRLKRTTPMSFMQWRCCWWGSQKARWTRVDEPRIMRERFARLKEEMAS